MVEPVGFVEAWKAQFPDSDPPEMSLNSVGDIEQELEKCRNSIRQLEMEVNKERFRMIYLQTLLAKERRSHDSQRWGFSRASQTERRSVCMDKADGGRRLPSKLNHTTAEEADHESQPCGEIVGGHDINLDKQADALSPFKKRSFETLPRPNAGCEHQHNDVDGLPESPLKEITTGLGVAALRSNFERIRRANSQTSCEGKGERPYYVNMEYHHEKGLVRVNDREVSEKISNLGSQAMQMERKRSLHSLPINLSTFGDVHKTELSQERTTDSVYNCDYEETDLNSGLLKESSAKLNGKRARQQIWHQSDIQPYTTVYVGGIMGDGEDLHLTWPRRSYSPGSFEDGYTPDCSSNENLTSSEEDFSSGQSSHVSPSPTAYRMYREKSRSPSQHSQQSFDSGSPPTPQSQKRLKQQLALSETNSGGRKILLTEGTPNNFSNSFHGDLGVVFFINEGQSPGRTGMYPTGKSFTSCKADNRSFPLSFNGRGILLPNAPTQQAF
ncbi:hypothetical protein DNTS_028455 [Danionella cerebrum]|uniref:Bcr-Abl oncoprotein oligomerisation domain-containing protein n=1 Tax=Danionella cerebrum TaxID=2873325 RepID=A0A553MZS6_9TELE|nr:hypothetical protein DNTS_028455 [Danionella translucida]